MTTLFKSYSPARDLIHLRRRAMQPARNNENEEFSTLALKGAPVKFCPPFERAALV